MFKIIVINHIVILLSLFLKTILDVRCLDIKYAEKSVVTNPIDSVTAKPFTGPDPNINKIIEAINVVMFASRFHRGIYYRYSYIVAASVRM